MSRRPSLFVSLSLCGVLLCALAFAQDSAPPPPAAPDWQPAIVVQFAVQDLDASVAFYRDVLGMRLLRRMDSPPWAQLATSLPGLSVGLAQEQSPAGSGSTSLNLGVSDCDAMRTLLESRGVTFDGPTQEIPGIVRLADFRDPDGNRLRLAGPSRR